MDEIACLETLDVTIISQLLKIAENIILILLLYSLIDCICEETSGRSRIGIIRYNIGPIYEDKVAYCVIHIYNLTDSAML